MMKKLTLLALALAAPTATFASNIAEGTWEVTGGTNLGYSSSSVKVAGLKQTSSSYGIETGVAYYLTPVVGLGLELNYSDTTTTDFDGFKSDQSTYMVGPKLVLDFGVAPQVSIFADAAVGIAGGDVDGVSIDGWGLGLAGGVKYFFSRNVSADIGLQYTLEKLEGTSGGVTEKADFADFRIGVRLSVYLNNSAAH